MLSVVREINRKHTSPVAQPMVRIKVQSCHEMRDDSFKGSRRAVNILDAPRGLRASSRTDLIGVAAL